MYFVTICTKSREEILSEINVVKHYCRGRVPSLTMVKNKLNTKLIIKNTPIGNCVEDSIKYINQIQNVKIEQYIIMPDHIHMIVEMDNIGMKNISNPKGRDGTLPLHAIIGRFKSYTTKQYNILNNSHHKKL